MSRAQLIALPVLATLLLYAGASPPALGHEFLVNGKGVEKGAKVEVEGSGAIFLEATIAKIAIHVECGEGLLPAGLANVLEEAGKFKSKLELKACAATIVNAAGVEEDQTKCKIPNFTLEGTGELTEPGIASVSGSAAEKVFGKIEISEVSGAGACSLAGTYELKGPTSCDIPDYLVNDPGFAVACNPPGGKEVKFASEPAKLDLSLGIEGTKGQSFLSN